jgi:hypothetical protein
MTGSLMAATRALYCCADAHVADAAVLGSDEAGEEGGFSALISSLADETALSERNKAQYECARLGRQLASPSANLRPCQKPAIRLRGLIDNRLQRERQRHWAAHLSAVAVRTKPSATSRTAGSTINNLCLGLTCRNSLISAKPHFGKSPKKRAPLQRRGAAQLGGLSSYDIFQKRDRLDRGLHLSRCG